MEKKPNIFEDTDLDKAVIAADDTGLVGMEHEIVEDEIEHAVPESPPPDEVP